MIALKSLAHGIHIADAFEAVIRTAIGDVDKVGLQVVADLIRVDELGHAEFFYQFLFRRLQIHPIILLAPAIADRESVDITRIV